MEQNENDIQENREFLDLLTQINPADLHFLINMKPKKGSEENVFMNIVENFPLKIFGELQNFALDRSIPARFNEQRISLLGLNAEVDENDRIRCYWNLSTQKFTNTEFVFAVMYSMGFYNIIKSKEVYSNLGMTSQEIIAAARVTGLGFILDILEKNEVREKPELENILPPELLVFFDIMNVFYKKMKAFENTDEKLGEILNQSQKELMAISRSNVLQHPEALEMLIEIYLDPIIGIGFREGTLHILPWETRSRN